MFRSVAVFCGSRLGNDPLYEQHARELGTLLGQKKITMVYGGGNKGLMGAIANAALEQDGKVIGVMPELLVEFEQQHLGLTDLHIVADMHVRKKTMYDLSDAAIVLPGGNGTLDELFEMITWNILSIHNKKIILLNTAGFYNQLLGHINQMQVKGFLYEDWKSMFEVHATPDAIFLDADKN